GTYRSTARATEARTEKLYLRPPPEQRSISLKFPWKGHLERGMLLRTDSLIRYVDEYVEHERFYGTWQLVQLVRRGAQSVADQYPGSPLSIGELSGAHGGPIPGHHSHRNGRDIDIAFYLVDDAGQPATARDFVPVLRKSGLAYFGAGKYHFDDARNWALIAKLLDDDDARVQYVFVSNAMQRRLLAQAARVHAPDWLVQRARTVMFEPKSGNRHQSHFHVRIYCPAEDRPYCSDRPPYHPWYDGAPPGGVTGQLMHGVAPEL
ncbi:MAG TPA: penicillin-insensitive murein endopeptidase, partial [Polyangiales bacterium]|nr:penicillin-insensitive murein endopeptidase [Polyangiales bacterium]